MKDILDSMSELSRIEDSLEALGPIDKLIERIEELEKMVKQTKTVLGFDEACKYIGVSESLLYKLTAAKEVPHYKPRGKMLYFNREEIDKWLLQKQTRGHWNGNENRN